MGYHQDLALSSKWLASIQREDDGWGLAPGQASSLVNTAEAIYVLARAGGYSSEIKRGLSFLERNVFTHTQRHGPRIRYVAFSLLALSENRHIVPGDLINRCCSWLEEARNTDNGWGVETAQVSELFPTFLALWALQSAGWPSDRLNPSLQWLLARSHDTGWSLDTGQGLSPVATSYALLCLARSGFRDHDRVRAGKEYLLQTRHWGMEEEVIAGTVWKHCTYAWVIPALLELDENPYSTVIAEGIRYINKQRSRDGGWNETENEKGRTVRAQFWSVFALDHVVRFFDPAIHVLRIDAERAEAVLSEPEFIKIAVHEKWATIVPAALYRLVAYSLLFLSPVVLIGTHRMVDELPIRADALLALALLSAAWFLIQRRQKQFPRSAKALRWVLAGFSVVSLVFGTDAETAMIEAKGAIVSLKGLLGK